MNKKSYSLFLILILSLCSERIDSATFYCRVNGNWTSATTWSVVSCSGAAAATVPGPTDNVVICAGRTVTMNGNPGNCMSLTVNGTANWASAVTTNVGSGGLTLNTGATLSGTAVGILNVSGAMAQSGTSTIGGITLAVTGTSTVSGTLSFNNVGGTKTFGSVVINSTGNFSSSVTETYSVTGSLTMNGGSLTGASSGAMNIGGNFIITAGTSAALGNMNLTVAGLTSINGALTDNSTGGSNVFNNVDLNATGSFNNTAAETYTINGNLNTYGGDFLATGATPIFNVAGNFNVVSGVCDVSRITISVAGTTTVSGTLSINSKRGTKTFNNLVVNASGNFNSAVNENYIVNGNITVNGVFGANLGVWTLRGIGKTISGTTAMNFNNITCNGSVTNNGNVTIATSLAGTGSWTQGAGSTLNIAATGGSFSVSTFNASAAGNTVNYNAAANQNIIPPADGSYANLSLSGSSTKTLNSATVLSGNLTISPSVTLDANNKNMAIAGNFTNNGTFSPGSLVATSTVTMNGTSAQTIGGTSATAFRNLTISNSSAIVTGATNFSVGGSFTVGTGSVFSPNAAVIVSGAGMLTGTGEIRVTRIAATPDFISQYTITSKVLSGLNTNYIGAGNQNVNALNYGSLTISTNGTRTVTFPAAVVGVSNVFSPSSVTTSYVVTGNTVNFNGTVSQMIPVFNYNHLTSSSTGARTLSPTGTIGVAGVFTPGTNTYTITGSTINYNGTGSQTVTAFNYYNLTSSSTGARTLASTGTVGVAATYTPGTNTFTVTGSTVNFNGTIAQGIPAFTYNHLTTSGSGAKTLSGNVALNGNLTINSNLDVSASSYSVSLKGNWTNNGTFTAQNGAVIFNGSAAQTLSSIGTTAFYRLDMNNSSGGVKLSTGAYTLTSVINPLTGNFNTNGQSFTMLSDATTTARIGQLGAGASMSGSFIIQRYISGRDTSFADLASPVQASTFLDWDNELPAISYSYSPPFNQPSAYTYDETADAYVPVTSSSAALTAGKGYEIFLAGDYSYGNLPNTTINAIGVPNQGTYNLSSMISNNVQGWNLVGNPYASSISWASIYTVSGGAGSGLYDYIEMYDYTIADWNGYTSADGIEIGSGQGFWVYGLPGAGVLTLIIPESSKTTASNSSIKSVSGGQYFTLKITGDKNSFSHTFRVRVSPQGENGLDQMDIPFHQSPSAATPQLYSVVDRKKINTNTFDGTSENYSIELEAKAGYNGRYRIDASGFANVSGYRCISLEDKVYGKFINLISQPSYEFEMKPTDPADRFALHFSKNGDCKASLVQNTGDLESNVEVLPSEAGSHINFSFSAPTSVKIEVMNVLGQELVRSSEIVAGHSSADIRLPADFSGVYAIRVTSSEGVVVKELFRN